MRAVLRVVAFVFAVLSAGVLIGTLRGVAGLVGGLYFAIGCGLWVVLLALFFARRRRRRVGQSPVVLGEGIDRYSSRGA